MKPTLYPHQEELKRKIYAEIRAGNRKVAVKAATSFGKTVLMASIIHDAISKGLRVVFTVPTLTLIDQTLIEFTNFGLDPGVIQGDHFCTDYSKMVQIASIQTIAAQLKRNNKYEMFQMNQYYKDVFVICDEFHQRFKSIEWLVNHTSKPCLGASATPWSKSLGLTWDTIVHGNDVQWLIDNGYLSKFRVFSHDVISMKGVSTGSNGDYSLKQSGEKYTPKIVGSIVGEWEKHAKGRQTILFCPRVVDAERFAEEFRQAGYKAVAVSGYLDNEDCRIEIERFKSHETMILCSVSKISTGFSVKDVSAIVDARPTKSLMTMIQSYGRGLRTIEGKEDCIIIDSAGNCLRNGLPTDDFPMHLDMGESKELADRKKKDDPLPTVCPACNAIKPPKVYICPSCQFEPKKQSTLEVESGNLVELKSASAKRNRDMSWDEKALFMSELVRHAQDRGFKPGWVYPNYKAYTGVLPFDRRLKNIAPAEVIREKTQRWITSQNIRYAKRRTA